MKKPSILYVASTPLLLLRGLLDDLRREPLEDRSCLGAGRVGRRLQLVMVVAVQQLGGNRPTSCRRGPSADGGGIRTRCRGPFSRWCRAS